MRPAASACECVLRRSLDYVNHSLARMVYELQVQRLAGLTAIILSAKQG